MNLKKTISILRQSTNQTHKQRKETAMLNLKELREKIAGKFNAIPQKIEASVEAMIDQRVIAPINKLVDSTLGVSSKIFKTSMDATSGIIENGGNKLVKAIESKAGIKDVSLKKDAFFEPEPEEQYSFYFETAKPKEKGAQT